jgi:hypothetical protein
VAELLPNELLAAVPSVGPELGREGVGTAGTRVSRHQVDSVSLLGGAKEVAPLAQPQHDLTGHPPGARRLGGPVDQRRGQVPAYGLRYTAVAAANS